MPDWDEDSPALLRNLTEVLRALRESARRRQPPSVEDARVWHKATMAGLDVEHKEFAGGFRGEGGELKNYRVEIDGLEGVLPEHVAGALQNFERRLRQTLRTLDIAYPQGAALDVDGLGAVLEVAAWAHAEWVRIHPFANGNGRTARLWANFILMRYGLPPVVRLRPRPDRSYGDAAAQAMHGDWQPMIAVFHDMLQNHLRDDAPKSMSTRTPTRSK